MSISLLVALCSFLAIPASAQEVFSWFNRGLLPVEFVDGDRVTYAVEEIDEYGAVRDTLTVSVVDAGSTRVWLRIETPRARDYVALDPRLVTPGALLLDAITRVVHDTETGLVEEDLDELRESALVQRHFTDPFREPEIRRSALPDTVVGGAPLAREAVELAEMRRETMGPVVVVTSLHARAQLSPLVPMIGLLRSWTLSEVTSESADGSRARRRPPVTVESSLTCIGFGRGEETVMPEGLETRN
jgi:hypothetical protein